MTQEHHKHSAPHRHTQGNEDRSAERSFHKDWRLWLAVGLMLTAMIVYVLTLDESIVPSIMGR